MSTKDFSSNDDGDGLKRSKMALDGKGKSQDQIDRRRCKIIFEANIFNAYAVIYRERNRVLARKTRLRKKFFFEVKFSRKYQSNCLIHFRTVTSTTSCSAHNGK